MCLIYTWCFCSWCAQGPGACGQNWCSNGEWSSGHRNPIRVCALHCSLSRSSVGAMLWELQWRSRRGGELDLYHRWSARQSTEGLEGTLRGKQVSQQYLTIISPILNGLFVGSGSPLIFHRLFSYNINSTFPHVVHGRSCIVFEFEWRAIWFGSLRADLILEPQYTDKYRMFFVQTSTLPPSMPRKLNLPNMEGVVCNTTNSRPIVMLS